MLVFVLRRIALAVLAMLAIDRFPRNANHDFNDQPIPPGAGYPAAPVEESLPIK